MVRAASIAVVLTLAGQEAFAAGAAWDRAGGPLIVSAGPAPEDRPLLARPPRDRPPQPYAGEIAVAATRHGLDPKLLHALVAVESAYREDSVSPAGAAGLTQLMPGTAADLGVSDRFDAIANLDAGALYLARQVERFGDLRLALAAYNAGPERVARLGRIPRIAETEAYVARVVDCYLALTAGRAIRSSRDCVTAEGSP